MSGALATLAMLGGLMVVVAVNVARDLHELIRGGRDEA